MTAKLLLPVMPYCGYQQKLPCQHEGSSQNRDIFFIGGAQPVKSQQQTDDHPASLHSEIELFSHQLLTKNDDANSSSPIAEYWCRTKL